MVLIISRGPHSILHCCYFSKKCILYIWMVNIWRPLRDLAYSPWSPCPSGFLPLFWNHRTFNDLFLTLLGRASVYINFPTRSYKHEALVCTSSVVLEECTVNAGHSVPRLGARSPSTPASLLICLCQQHCISQIYNWIKFTLKIMDKQLIPRYRATVLASSRCWIWRTVGLLASYQRIA